MNLYTLLIDFRGGTYISQVQASNEKDALVKGISNLNPSDVEFMGEKVKQEMVAEALEEDPIAIKQTINVFIAGILPMGHFTTVHLILTKAKNE